MWAMSRGSQTLEKCFVISSFSTDELSCVESERSTASAHVLNLTTNTTYVANEDKGPLNAVGLDLGDGLLNLLAELCNPACLVALG